MRTDCWSCELGPDVNLIFERHRKGPKIGKQKGLKMMRHVKYSIGLISLVAAAAFAADATAPAAKRATATARAPSAATAAAGAPVVLPGMSAEQIVERNVQARGGLEAWRAVKTLALTGKIQAGGAENPELPFVMKMKRPHSSRLELRFGEQAAVQVYDGSKGWKVRPYLNRKAVEPYTPAEEKQASGWEELDGPLIDYARKGTQVTLVGTEAVEGQPAYKLKLTLKDGQQRNVWIDGSTFLERKIDGDARKVDGKMHAAFIFYRDFKKQGGLTIPTVLETLVEGAGQKPHKLSVDTIAINEATPDSLFSKPDVGMTKTAGR